MAEDIRIRIIAEAELDGAVKALEHVLQIEKHLIEIADSAKKSLEGQNAQLNKLIDIEKGVADATSKAAKAAEEQNKPIREQTGLIEKLQQKMLDLRKARIEADNLGDVIKLNHQISETQKEIDKLTGATEKGAGMFKNLWTTLGTLFVADRLIDYSKQLFSLVNETDRLDTALKNVHGTTEDYNKSIVFLNGLSDTYGQNVNVLTKSYTNFIASSNSANLSLEERQRIFGSVIKAGAALKLSNDDIEGSLRALSQMFSKGNIQAEELRGQLGERLPGAFDLTAKAMGITTMQLNKMLEDGEVLAVDVLPLLATELEKTYGSKGTSNVQTFAGAWNRLTNQVIGYTKEINEATGFTKIVAGAVNLLADNLGWVIKATTAAVTAVAAYNRGLTTLRVTKALLGGATDALTAEQLMFVESVGKTRAALFSALPMVAAVSAAIYVAFEAFTAVKQAIDDVNAVSLDYIKTNDEAIKSEKAKDVELRIAIDHIKTLKEGTEARTYAVQQAINKFPEYLKGIDAEIASNAYLEGVYKNVNAQMQKRIELMARERQVSAINDQILALRQRFLSEGISSTTAEEYQREVRERGYGTASFGIIQMKQYEELTRKAIDADKALAQHKQKAAEEELTIITRKYGAYEILKSQQMQMTNAVYEKYSLNQKLFTQEEIQEQRRIDISKGEALSINQRKESLKALTALRDDSNDPAKIAKYNSQIKEQQKLIDQLTGKELKTNKEREKSTKDMAVAIAGINERLYKDTLKAAEAHTKEYLSAIKNGGEEEIKNRKKVLDNTMSLLEQQYLFIVQMNYLRKVAAAKSTKEIEQIEKDHRDELLSIQLRNKQVELDANSAHIARLKALVSNGDLEAIAQLATAQSTQLKLQEEYNALALKSAENRAEENTNIVKKGEEERKEATEKGEEKVTSLVKDQEEKRKKLRELAAETTIAIAEAALSVYSVMWEDRMSKANTETEKALLENERMWTQWGASVTSVLGQFAKGDWVGGVVSAVAWLGQGIANLFTASNRRTKAELQDLRNYYEGVISTWTDFMSDSQSDIEKYYGSLMNLEKAAVDYTKAISEYDPKFIIDNELLRAKTIAETYNKAVDLEKNYYELQKKRVQEVYDEEIRRINQVFDIKNDNADLAVNAETMAVKDGMVDQLLALITNEESKTSVTEEYAAKRKQIEDTFYLADEGRRDAIKDDLGNLNGQLSGAQYDLAAINNELNSTAGITEERRAELLKTKGALESTIAGLKATINSTQNEYDAVTDSIKERDKALSNLLDWYTDELEAIIGNEGQKRTEYSETERIRKEGEEKIDAINLKATQDSIARNQYKNQKIIEAQQALDYSLEYLAEIHNDNIVFLTQQKDAAIMESWDLVRATVIAGYDAIMAKADEAYQKGLISLEQYRAFVAEINNMNAALGTGAAAIADTRIDYSIDTNASKADEKFMKQQGLWAANWSDLAKSNYSKWLESNGLVDTPTNRIEYFMIQGNAFKYAHGTEYVPLGKNPPGVDTVPAFLTKGERVMTVDQNRRLGGMSNDQVVAMANTGYESMKAAMAMASNTNTPFHELKELANFRIDPEIIRKMDEMNAQRALMQMSMKMDLQPVIDRLESLEQAISNIPIQNFTLDQDGLSKFVKRGNAITKYHQKRYGD